MIEQNVRIDGQKRKKNKKKNRTSVPKQCCNRLNEVGWLVVLGLTVLLDSSSVYIGPSPRKREKEEK